VGDHAAQLAAIKISEGFNLGYCKAKPGHGPEMHCTISRIRQTPPDKPGHFSTRKPRKHLPTLLFVRNCPDMAGWGKTACFVTPALPWRALRRGISRSN
jgi:hypothetical protein